MRLFAKRPFYSVPACVGTCLPGHFILPLKTFRVWVEVVKWLLPSNLRINSTEFHTLCGEQDTLYSPHLWKVSVKWTSIIESLSWQVSRFFLHFWHANLSSSIYWEPYMFSALVKSKYCFRTRALAGCKCCLCLLNENERSPCLTCFHSCLARIQFVYHH